MRVILGLPSRLSNTILFSLASHPNAMNKLSESSFVFFLISSTCRQPVLSTSVHIIPAFVPISFVFMVFSFVIESIDVYDQHFRIKESSHQKFPCRLWLIFDFLYCYFHLSFGSFKLYSIFFFIPD